MKKRDAILLVAALACLYFILSFSIVFEIDQIGTREQLRLRRARQTQLEAKSKQVSWFYDFFERRCRCPDLRGGHARQSQQSAHALAVHATFDKDICHVSQEITKNHNVDIQLSEVLREARLSYPQYLYHHTGWIQQMDVSYSTDQWQEEPLRVFFILHSHNDPGWQHKYETYYSMWTNLILSKAVDWLEKDASLKFVWAEVIYLRKWYEDAPASKKRSIHRVISTGQLEVVTGGLVMTDEASAHYYAMLDQLIEGHQWLAKTFNVYPRYGWAIDPFGHSSTMAYLLKRSGIEATLIQRIHYALKQHFAYRKELEFLWEQNWDNGHSDTRLLTHLMPFLSYSISYSCGPDIQVCCQIDFQSSKCWAWGKYKKPEPINDDNVKIKSEALLDQLRKKAQFYNHNVLLVPHGDDFRYTSDDEWRKQTQNLKKMFTYMNNRPDMRVKIEFGTLADYFGAIKEKVESSGKSHLSLPSLSGDFFTYTDRDDQYWSGYFTSRPHLKTLIRKLQSYLRSSEILYTLGQAYSSRQSRRITADYITPLQKQLMDSRTTLGLLQHHDAVTGTARKKVVQDYTERANTALENTRLIIKRMISTLMQLSLQPDVGYENFHPDIVDMHDDVLPVPTSLDRKVKDVRKLRHTLIVHNPLGFFRTDMAIVTVPNIDVLVTDVQGQPVKCQLDPVWETDTAMSEVVFQLSFEVKLPALGMVQYHILPTEYGQGCPRSNITIFNGKPVLRDRTLFHIRHHSMLDRPQSIENALLVATVCACTGLLKTVTTKIDGIEHQTEMRVVTYGTGSWSNPYRDKSGAYIFMPDGSAQEVKYDDPILVVSRGPLASSLLTHVPLMSQKITLYGIRGPAAAVLHLENKVNITGERNLELAMRLITDVNNMDSSFHTDLNGFQMSQRFTQSRLPLQGNFYPMTTAAFIQDDLFRLTLLSGQSHGVSGLHTGWLEVILDRELEQDDWRGLKEGIQDNVPVTSKFQLIWESRKPTFHKEREENYDDPVSSMEFLSLLGHLSSHMLNYPLITASLQTQFTGTLSPAMFEPLNEALPCDMFLVNLKTITTSDVDFTALLILHRLVSDCQYPEVFQVCDAADGKVKWSTLLSQLSITRVEETSLTGTQFTRAIHHSYLIVHPMEINAFKIDIN